MADEQKQPSHQLEMADEQKQQVHQLEREQAQDSTYEYLGTAGYDRMTIEERERQVERRVPKSEVFVTWVILIGVTALVVLGVVLSLFVR